MSGPYSGPQSDITHRYRCCQDAAQKKKSKSKGKRGRGSVERFACNGRLVFRERLQDRIQDVDLEHSYHAQYKDKHLSKDVLDFISKRVETSTAAAIYRDLKNAKLADNVPEYKVYYQWRQANIKLWRHDKDQFTSVEKLLAQDGMREKFTGIDYTPWGVKAFAIFVKHQSLPKLAVETKELAIDATYGTNNSGMDLYAVLAEVDGTGVPIAYMFVNRSGPKDDNPKPNCPIVAVLQKLLLDIKTRGFSDVLSALCTSGKEIDKETKWIFFGSSSYLLPASLASVA